MEKLWMALVVIFTLLFYIGSMWFYKKTKKRFSSSKYLSELMTLLLAFIIDFVIKMVAVCLYASDTSSNTAFFFVIYECIGNLGFQGLSLIEEFEPIWQCVYICSSLYIGCVFVSIITAKANYEIFSWLSFALSSEKNKNVYIFTAISDDALTIAKSIKDEYEKENAGKKISKRKKKCVIVFAGSEIPPFDRKNPLCCEAMKEGFYYWSHAKDNEKSIVECLHINNHNKERFDLRCVVFAFAKDGDNIPEEEENSGVVFEDMHKRLRLEKNDMRIEYIILNERAINYEAYDRNRRGLLINYAEKNNPKIAYFLEKYGDNSAILQNEEELSLSEDFTKYLQSPNESNKKSKDFKKASKDLKKLNNEYYIDLLSIFKKDEKLGIVINDKFKEYVYGSKKVRKNNEKAFPEAFGKVEGKLSKDIADYVSFEVWNESEVVARHTIEKIINETGIIDSIVSGKKDIRVWSLGFGETNQAIIRQLFTQLAYIDDNTKSEFTVEAFDRKMDDIDGIFMENHQLCTTIGVKENKEITDVVSIFVSKYEKFIKKYISEATAKTILGIKKDGVNVNAVESLLKITTPLIKCKKINDLAEKKQEKTKELYFQLLGKIDDKKDEERIQNGMVKEITFPTYFLNEISCTDEVFFQSIDKVTGQSENNNVNVTVEKIINEISETKLTDDGDKKMLGYIKGAKEYFVNKPYPARPDYILISTGDDFRNIQLANTFIKDIAYENKGDQQTIIVNVRDKRNNTQLINANGVWENNILKLPRLDVIVVGNADENGIYSYKYTVDHSDFAKYNFAYECISKAINKECNFDGDDIGQIIKDNLSGKSNSNDNKNIIMWIDQAGKIWSEIDKSGKINSLQETNERNKKDGLQQEGGDMDTVIKALVATFKDRFENEEEKTKENEWNQLDGWKKESNRSAEIYKKMHKTSYEKDLEKISNPPNPTDDEKAKIYAKLCRLEHCRWVRFHIINGWKAQQLGAKTDELLKLHNCILPEELLDNGTIAYDLINVVLALSNDGSNATKGEENGQ